MPMTGPEQAARSAAPRRPSRTAVLMLAISSVLGDVRILREASALTAAGFHVTVIGQDVPAGVRPAGVDIVSVARGTGLRRHDGDLAGPHPGRAVAAALRWLALPEHRRLAWSQWRADALAVAENLSFDIVHAHVFTTLDLGHALARAREVPLVYDTHELWSRRFRVGRPTPLQTGRDRRRERRLGSDAAAVITIGEDLADRLVRDFGWGGVEVVRNTFDPIAVDASNDPPRPHAAVYAGRLGPGRDLETVAAASRRTPVPIWLQGPAAPGWLRGFDVGACSVTPAQEPAEVTATMRRAGLVLVPLSDTCDNHRVALPNKLFQAVAAGVPLVAADVGALAAVVRSRGIGTLYRPGDVASLGVALQQAVENYDRLRLAVDRAAEALSWEVDRRRLVDVYRRIAR